MAIVLVKDNLKIVTYALQWAGYTVIAAESGEEGFELALKEKPKNRSIKRTMARVAGRW
jgi:DNA-binding response OmpR family regulator